MSHRLFVCGLALALLAVIGSLGLAIAQQQQRSRAELVERFEMRA